MEHSQEFGKASKSNLIESVRVAKIVKSNISSGRKVFKFLKFVDEYEVLSELLDKFQQRFSPSESKENKKDGPLELTVDVL